MEKKENRELLNMNGKRLYITNVLNHNTLVCTVEETKETYMFFGKGIGYGKKRGDEFTYNDAISETMLVLENHQIDQYKELLSRVHNQKLIEVVNEVVHEANKFFDNQVNANLHFTLLDHLNFAFDRKKQNINITYPFMNEVQFLYPKEYQFSKQALQFVNEQMKGLFHFPDQELGFLVLHIHAAVTDSKVSKVLRNTQILHDCTVLIEENIGEKLDTQSIYYSRFSKHLEYAIHRNKNHIKIKNVLLDNIKTAYAEDYELAKQINQLLEKKYRTSLDDDEIGYLAIHIVNLRQKK